MDFSSHEPMLPFEAIAMTDAPETPSEDPPFLVWIDLETTGLDPDNALILEVAVIVTMPDLLVLDRFAWLVKPPEGELWLSEWAARQHTENGLLDAVRGEDASPIADVDKAVEALSVFQTHQPSAVRPYLAGSSVHFDRRMMERFMPNTLACLHYRNIDVSTIRRTARRLWPDAELPPTSDRHRAEPDIEASLATYRWFIDKARQPLHDSSVGPTATLDLYQMAALSDIRRDLKILGERLDAIVKTILPMEDT